jgi:hypothetical protein
MATHGNPTPAWTPRSLPTVCGTPSVVFTCPSLLYTPVTKTIPNQEEAWWKLSPTTTSFFVNRTGLRSNITFDLWQIYRDTCGCGSSHSCRRCSSSSFCCWAKALEDLKGSAQAAMTVLPLVYFGATAMDKKQFESNLYIHTLACIIVQSSYMCNSGMYQLIVIRIYIYINMYTDIHTCVFTCMSEVYITQVWCWSTILMINPSFLIF